MKLTTDVLIGLLRPGDPLHRLESFMALECVIDFMRNRRGQWTGWGDAPRIVMAGKMKGLSLSLLDVRTAIERLQRVTP